MKTCAYCKEPKPLSEFGQSSRSKDGREYSCLECRRAICQQWRGRNQEKVAKKNARERASTRRLRPSRREVHWKSLPVAEYNALHDGQDGKCAICREPETAAHQSGQLKTLAVDHDHETGKIRGLLCSRCNTAIGLLRHNEQFVEAAGQYLRKHQKIIRLADVAVEAQSSEANWSVVP